MVRWEWSRGQGPLGEEMGQSLVFESWEILASGFSSGWGQLDARHVGGN